ncbi:MAG: hypothetical protein QOK61_06295 [Nitrososphaeraceae archaeon]|nr:hypothetical protein [Nitrososphaeraceae archaeon]
MLTIQNIMKIGNVLYSYMSTTNMTELERQEEKINLDSIAGKPQHIEINERSLVAYREAFAKKGLVIQKHKDYPKEDFFIIRKQKKFDSIVDPSKGIRKIIHNMIRQPITVFDKTGKAVIKDALYYNGQYRGHDKRDVDIGAPFHEGSFKKPRLVFSFVDPAHPFDSVTGEKRGVYTTSGFTYQHYIFLSEDKKERRKQLEDIIQKATGTYKGNLENGHLHFRNPTPDNNHSGTHGGSFK